MIVVEEIQTEDIQSKRLEKSEVGIDRSGTHKNIQLEVDDVVDTQKGEENNATRSKRNCSKSAICRSPFTTNFGSAECKDIVLFEKKIQKGVSTFADNCLHVHSKEEMKFFDEWFKIGYNWRKKKNKFSELNDVISPASNFGISTIGIKMWFFNLKTPNMWLDNEFI
ncbi:hypothetical protein OROMI_034532 [Orobanche minor]